MIETLPSGIKFESFEEDEVASMTPDELECALALSNKLNLKGQQRIYAKPDPSDSTALATTTARKPLTFREISAVESTLYRTLFSKEIPLVEYDRGPVPIRVLALAEKAVEAGLFDLTVWCPLSESDKDPVLVASGGAGNSKKTYILARWTAARPTPPITSGPSAKAQHHHPSRVEGAFPALKWEGGRQRRAGRRPSAAPAPPRGKPSPQGASLFIEDTTLKPLETYADTPARLALHAHYLHAYRQYLYLRITGRSLFWRGFRRGLFLGLTLPTLLLLILHLTEPI